MQESTVTTKGQTTLPKDVRTALQLHPGDRVRYMILDGGEVRLVRSRPVMQLAGLLDEDLRRMGGSRSVVQKIGQAVSAEMLERSWRKDQILEAYLNLVPFRGELVGIDALSRTLFGKAASGLDNREAAIAAALVRAPNAPSVQVGQRACTVWRAMEPAVSAMDCDGIVFFAQAALQRREFAATE
eukprot:gene49782-66684_t